MTLAVILLSMTLFGGSYSTNLAESLIAEGITDSNATLLGQSLLAAPPIGTLLSRTGWTVTCDSSHAGNECDKVLDGDVNTFWHSEYQPTAAPLPHTITIDMKAVQTVNGLAMLPRQDGNANGLIAGHTISVSQDARNWELVAFGTWYADNTEKISEFEAVRARYMRLVHTTEPKNQAFTAVAEINVYASASYTAPQASLGIWGPTIDTPIVPVATAVLPNGNVLMWSSYAKDTFVNGPGGVTLTAIYNPNDRTITQRTVSNTLHDMFCPGVSTDFNGRVIVTGGNNAPRTSIYDPASNSWISAPDMNIARGYQSSCTCSSGRIFTIGGSWSGNQSIVKNGEIYDTATNKWTLLPGCPVKPMLTSDKKGTYRADNHAMLFAWSNDMVLQAGPSTAMNWYTVTGTGGQRSAGTRGGGPDAMCGVAVMFDAVGGKILVAGGSPNYDDTAATTNAYVITIGQPNANVAVRATGNKMIYPRIFVNAVVLPNEEVFICGGQGVGLPFQDTGAQLSSEIYSPKDDRFRLAAANSIPRVYHSVALLMKDGTVVCGGGGLCGTCKTNHFNFQTYSPSYLFNADGSRATRPVITSVSVTTIKPGGRLDIRTDSSVASASLCRLGSATHSVNTDQRRVALDLKVAGTNAYSVTLPADSGKLLPGYWFLFVMNAKGTPSSGTTIKVTSP